MKSEVHGPFQRVCEGGGVVSVRGGVGGGGCWWFLVCMGGVGTDVRGVCRECEGWGRSSYLGEVSQAVSSGLTGSPGGDVAMFGDVI